MSYFYRQSLVIFSLFPPIIKFLSSRFVLLPPFLILVLFLDFLFFPSFFFFFCASDWIHNRLRTSDCECDDFGSVWAAISIQTATLGMNCDFNLDCNFDSDLDRDEDRGIAFALSAPAARSSV